jgi:hypothetical protein
MASLSLSPRVDLAMALATSLTSQPAWFVCVVVAAVDSDNGVRRRRQSGQVTVMVGGGRW